MVNNEANKPEQTGPTRVKKTQPQRATANGTLDVHLETIEDQLAALHNLAIEAWCQNAHETPTHLVESASKINKDIYL